jgi:hypothetical protein
VRRLVALLVIALLGATLYGLSSNSSGISVNGTTISGSTVRTELAAIHSNATLACYVELLSTTSFAPGAGGSSVSATAATAWANLRVEGLAIDAYAKKTLKYRPSAADLAKAKTSLEEELSSASQGSSTPCTGTSVQALAEMPTEMRNFEVASQAASLDLVSKLDTTVPLTVASMKKYYSTHTSDYICVSVAVVDPTRVTAFQAAEKSGKSIAQLAEKFSVDPSASTGGAYGCFGPSSTSYSGVQSATAATPINRFSTTPEQITYEGQTAALFVARTTTTFAKAESAVLSDLENANATAANTEKESILYYSAISIDPAFGRWGLGTSGPQVFAPALPSSKVVGAQTVAALAVGASTYK